MAMLVQAVRDWAIVVLAAMSLVVCFLLVVLILELRGLVRLLRREGKPILESARGTLGVVEGTAGFVSDRFVAPLIRAASFLTGLRTVLGFLARRQGRRRDR